jgi:hypothetical protein
MKPHLGAPSGWLPLLVLLMASLAVLQAWRSSDALALWLLPLAMCG